MTTLLCHEDAYARACDARVQSVSDVGLVLDRTVFYPGGGGQPADRGWLEGPDGARRQVGGVKRIGGRPVHLLEGPSPPLDVGDRVRLEIDWPRRYDLMRTHTALHILCGVVWRDHGAQVTGGNMTPLEGRLDFEFETLDRALVDEIEEAVNREVEAARPVEVRELPREEAFQIPDLIRTKINLLPKGIDRVRTVDIVGLDLQADGGTHVANTSEVGPIRILGYKSKGRLNKRIRIGLDPRPAPEVGEWKEDA